MRSMVEGAITRTTIGYSGDQPLFDNKCVAQSLALSTACAVALPSYAEENRHPLKIRATRASTSSLRSLYHFQSIWMSCATFSGVL